MGFKLGELIILFIIIMVLFGAKRLPELGGAIGEAIKNFKKGVGDEHNQSAKQQVTPTAQEETKIIAAAPATQSTEKKTSEVSSTPIHPS